MGNTNSNNNSGITIALTNRSTDDPIYFLGEHVECTVQFVNTQQHSDLKLKDAYVELVGQFPLMTDIMQINPDGTTYTMPSVEQVVFFNQRRSLLTELTQVNTKTLYETGVSDKWSFSFTLPGDLPPSISPTFVYCIRVVLEVKKWHRRNLSHFIPITVYPRIDIPNHLYHPLTLDTNRKDVRLHVSIPQSVISPGFHLPIQYDLYNLNQSTIKEIIVKLHQYRSMAKSKPLKTVILKMDVPNVNNFQGERFHDQFELTVPTQHLPPTLFYTSLNNPLLLQFNPISVTYEVEMEVKVHGILNNLTLTFPVAMNAEVESSSPPSYNSATKFS